MRQIAQIGQIANMARVEEIEQLARIDLIEQGSINRTRNKHRRPSTHSREIKPRTPTYQTKHIEVI